MSSLERLGPRRGEGDRRKRRGWSVEDKRRIVAETFESGTSVSVVARRHDLNANTLFTWRREAKRAAGPMIETPPTFVPAKIAAEPAVLAPPPGGTTGRMEIVLDDGARVIVAADVDMAALGRVLKV